MHILEGEKGSDRSGARCFVGVHRHRKELACPGLTAQSSSSHPPLSPSSSAFLPTTLLPPHIITSTPGWCISCTVNPNWPFKTNSDGFFQTRLRHSVAKLLDFYLQQLRTPRFLCSSILAPPLLCLWPKPGPGLTVFLKIVSKLNTSSFLPLFGAPVLYC